MVLVLAALAVQEGQDLVAQGLEVPGGRDLADRVRIIQDPAAQDPAAQAVAVLEAEALAAAEAAAAAVSEVEASAVAALAEATAAVVLEAAATAVAAAEEDSLYFTSFYQRILPIAFTAYVWEKREYIESAKRIIFIKL